MLTFGQIYTNVAVLVQRDQDTTFIAKCQNWVNMGAVKASNMYDYWEELQVDMQPFTSVNGQPIYYMPSDFDKPTRLWDFTNNKPLTIQTREEYVDANIASVSANTTGIPQYASVYGVSAVNYVATSSFKVQAKSSSILDTAGFIVRVEGWLDAAKTILGYTNITISSSSPTSYVVDPNSTVFYGVTRVTKSGTTMGFISLADQSGIPNVMANVSPNDAESRYPKLYLGLTPSGSYQYHGTYKRKIKRMVDTNDYPFADIEDYLQLYALAWAYLEEKETIPRSQVAFEEAKELIMQQIRNQMDKLGPDHQHKFVPQTSQTHRF